MINIHFNLDGKSTDWVERGKFKTELTLDLQLNGEWRFNSREYFVLVFPITKSTL
jgi:hypothetical protein